MEAKSKEESGGVASATGSDSGGLWERSRLTDPCKGMVGLGTAERAEMCSCSLGMRTDGVGASNAVVDADFFPVWSTNGGIDDLRPGRLAVREFCRCVPIVVMLVDGMTQLTTEDAANWVMVSAALRKWLAVVARGLSTT